MKNRKPYFFALIFGITVGFFFTAGQAWGQTTSDRPETPFKLITYSLNDGMPHVGLVFDNDTVVRLTQANQALEQAEGLPRMALPDDMVKLLDLEASAWPRLYQAANFAGRHMATGSNADGVHMLDEVTLEAPLIFPRKVLCVAANYASHTQGMARAGRGGPPGRPAASDDEDDDDEPGGGWGGPPGGGAERTPGPYLFPKTPTTSVIATGDTIRIREGRNRVDWEVELAVVIGKRGADIKREDAEDYIFGYTIMNDVSDRGFDGPPGFPGPNWFHGKSRDTSAPLGPFVVPKAFVKDPDNLSLKTMVNGEVMQDGNTKDMTYKINHMIEYVSSLLTLEPGDVIATGTPSGTGMERGVFLKHGDEVTLMIEGLGALSNPVKVGR